MKNHSALKKPGAAIGVVLAVAAAFCLSFAFCLTASGEALFDESSDYFIGADGQSYGVPIEGDGGVIAMPDMVRVKATNGEIGYVTEINERQEGKKREQYCVVTFTNVLGETKKVEYTKKELSTLDLAYAMTVHKLQGAGRKIVIGIIDNTHHQLLDNCMLYTMLTRAKQRCLLLAEPQAFLQCIRTSHNKRNTWMMLEDKE